VEAPACLSPEDSGERLSLWVCDRCWHGEAVWHVGGTVTLHEHWEPSRQGYRARWHEARELARDPFGRG